MINPTNRTYYLRAIARMARWRPTKEFQQYQKDPLTREELWIDDDGSIKSIQFDENINSLFQVFKIITCDFDMSLYYKGLSKQYTCILTKKTTQSTLTSSDFNFNNKGTISLQEYSHTTVAESMSDVLLQHLIKLVQNNAK